MTFKEWLEDQGISPQQWEYIKRGQPTTAARMKAAYQAYTSGQEHVDPEARADIDAWTAYTQLGGTLSYEDWEVQGKPGAPPGFKPGDYGEPTELYNHYRANGGTLSYEDWKAAGSPSAPPPEDGPPEARPRDRRDGVVVDDKPPPPPPPPPPPLGEEDEDEEDFSQQLAAAVRAWQEEQRRVGELQVAEAQRLGARGIGKMSRMTQQALLAQGRTAGEIEQLTAGGMEAGARSLSDLIKQINLQTQQQVAGAQQFGIGTMISGEELGIRQREMAMAGGRFQQTLAEQIRQFNLAQQQQVGQFGQRMGMREQEARYGMYGDIAQGLGSFFGGLFG